MEKCLLAVANEDEVHLICPELFRKEVNAYTKTVLSEAGKVYKVEAAANDKKEQHCKWVFQGDREEAHPHILASITFKNIVSRLAWHSKADYLSTMAYNI